MDKTRSLKRAGTVQLRIYTKPGVQDHGSVHELTRGGDGDSPEHHIIWSELVAVEQRPRE